MAETASELYQRQQELQVRLRLLEAEAVDLEGKRGQAVLDGGDALARLHQRVAEVERERADVTAAIATLGPQLEAAQARELEQAREEQRATVLGLSRQRVELAAGIDRVLAALEAHVVAWRGLGDAIAMQTTPFDDGANLAAALWAAAPATASLLLGPQRGGACPLAVGDGAVRLAQRVQQRAAPTEATLAPVEAA
jgi:hypothetical protein